MNLVKRRKVRGKKVYLIDIPASIAGRRIIRRAVGQTEGLAKAEADKILLRHLRGEPLLDERDGSDLTVKEFVEGRFAELYRPKYRPSTAARYAALDRQFLFPVFGSTLLRHVDTRAILKAATDLKARGLTTKGPLVYLRTVLKAARQCGELAKLPEWPEGVVTYSKPLPDCPSDEEVAEYLRLAALDGPDWFYRALVIAIFTGCRMGELRALQAGDVCFETNVLHIRRALSEDVEAETKTNAHRVVPIDEDGPLLPVLRALSAGKAPASRLVLTSRGTTPRRTHLLTVFKTMQVKHGLRARSWHSLRHYFCSSLCRRSVPLSAVMKLAGHSSIAVTNRYTHAADRDLRAAIKTLSASKSTEPPPPSAG